MGTRSSRRDNIVVDTVTLQQDTGQYVAVNRDGTIAGVGDDPFGVTMSSESAGAPVRVTRFGFAPVTVALAADNTSEGTELAIAADGEFAAVRTSGGGTDYVSAVSEEPTDVDQGQTGAWVDCLSAGRDRAIPA